MNFSRSGAWLGAALLAASLVIGTPAPAAEPSRTAIHAALWRHGVLHPDRRVVHLSHACDLRIGTARYHVIDLRELVRGAMTPRGVNRIVVLTADLRLANELDYTDQRPLFCVANRLYVWGDLALPDGGAGNVLSFRSRARRVSAGELPANDLPVPRSGDRRTPPQ